jgi:beta-lactamase regulating signal transducer with metallopeptidase domain
MTVLLLDSAVRVSLVTAIALLVLAALRGRSAALRHWVLASAILCGLALPALQALVPSWPVPVSVPAPVELAAGPVTSLSSGVAGSPARNQATRSYPAPAIEVLGWLWLAGTALFAAVLATGLARMAWLSAGARPVENTLWHTQLRELSQWYGLTRPVRLLQSDRPALLVTWDWRSPRILLPITADAWPADRIRVVLAHELAHVIRHDWLTQIAADVLRACYWFNPLVWLAGRRLREESERACDDAVLATGVEGSSYATHLLDVARGFAVHRRAWSPAPAIASPSHLERRVRAMLDARLNRRPPTPLARLAIAIAAIGATIPVAAVAQATFSTFSGSVLDPMNGLLPKTTLVLTNTKTEAKYEVRADAAGRFEFVGLPPSEYLLEAALPGFATLRGGVVIGGQDVSQEIRLNVGELEETITVTGGATDRPRRAEPQAVRKRPLPSCPDALAGGIGGRIRPPHKIRDVSPVYPVGVVDARGEEVVRLIAVINTDGTVKDVQLAGPANPAFAAAAIDAVRQWEFDETLLNCVPTEVSMRATVSFRAQ